MKLKFEVKLKMIAGIEDTIEVVLNTKNYDKDLRKIEFEALRIAKDTFRKLKGERMTDSHKWQINLVGIYEE